MEHPENDDQYKGLKVNKGIADVPTVNPYIKKRVQRKVYTPSEFVEGIFCLLYTSPSPRDRG